MENVLIRLFATVPTIQRTLAYKFTVALWRNGRECRGATAINLLPKFLLNPTHAKLISVQHLGFA